MHPEIPGPSTPIANLLRTVSPNYAFEIQTPEGFLSQIIHDMNQKVKNKVNKK